jgi:outer membrane protein assembly factor BamB
VVWGLRGSFRFQHEATLLENGHLLLFDNTGAGEHSRVLELDPRSGEVVWSYEQSEPPVFFSLCCGTAQRLPNGNTLVTETQRGRAFEVDPLGRLVWEYRTPHRVGPEQETLANLFEVRRVPEDFVAAWLGSAGTAPAP